MSELSLVNLLSMAKSKPAPLSQHHPLKKLKPYVSAAFSDCVALSLIVPASSLPRKNWSKVRPFSSNVNPSIETFLPAPNPGPPVNVLVHCQAVKSHIVKLIRILLTSQAPAPVPQTPAPTYQYQAPAPTPAPVVVGSQRE